MSAQAACKQTEGALHKEAKRIVGEYARWQAAIARSSKNCSCFREPEHMRTTCEVHRLLAQAISILQKKAGDIEDLLIKRGTVKKSIVPCGSGERIVMLTIQTERGPGYSFKRFAPGWLDMFQRYSD